MKRLIFALLSLASLGAAGSDNHSEVQTVPYVDLNRYIGTWHEVASIPQRFQKQCIKNTTAEYSLDEKGHISVKNSCETETGDRSVALGRAKIVDHESNSKLKVTFVKFIGWIYLFGGNYWIIDLDADYSYAVVGDPTRRYAWILSRSPSIDPEKLQRAITALNSQGYDTCELLTSIQDNGFSKRVPLCEISQR